MPQSSLTTWLNKPKAVTEPLAACRGRDNGLNDEQTESVPEPPTSETPRQQEQWDNIAGRKTESHSTNSGFRRGLSLPSNAEIRSCTKEDITQLKRLTSLLLQIPYPESFYKEITEDEVTNNITLLAMWHEDPTTKGKDRGRLVGAIRCRLLNPRCPSNDLARHDESPMLYLSTLVLLSPYRGHGVASHMLDILTRRAIEDYGISRLGAHVWVSNAEGREWYKKRGFQEIRHEPGYYRRLDPPDAVVMQREIRVFDLI